MKRPHLHYFSQNPKIFSQASKCNNVIIVPTAPSTSVGSFSFARRMPTAQMKPWTLQTPPDQKLTVAITVIISVLTCYFSFNYIHGVSKKWLIEFWMMSNIFPQIKAGFSKRLNSRFSKKKGRYCTSSKVLLVFFCICASSIPTVFFSNTTQFAILHTLHWTLVQWSLLFWKILSSLTMPVHVQISIRIHFSIMHSISTYHTPHLRKAKLTSIEKVGTFHQRLAHAALPTRGWY